MLSAAPRPWIKPCAKAALESGGAQTLIDGIGLLPEGGLLSAVIGGVENSKQTISSAKFAIGLLSGVNGASDTSGWGISSSLLGVAGIATTLAKAAPVVGQGIAVLSMGVDVARTGYEAYTCK